MVMLTNTDASTFPFVDMFEEKYVVKKFKDILLSSIKVITLREDGYMEGEINFEIKNISGELTIYPLQKAHHYVIKAKMPVDINAVNTSKNPLVAELFFGGLGLYKQQI